MALLSVNNLSVSFHLRNGTVRAVGGVSFGLERGEVVGVVGESGCGKSAMCLSLLQLIPRPPGRVGGSALFDDVDLVACDGRAMRRLRGDRISMIFQDPLTSLNPYMRIADQLIEPLRIHRGMSRKAAIGPAINALEEAGIADAKQRIRAWPHEFSGGMRQRVMIAMALITRPALLIADEPTTALDVTVQAQILALLRALIASHGMAVLFITHNLGIVAQLCKRVIVMYAGQVMEQAATADLFKRTAHPYTAALIKTLPSAHAPGEELYVIEGLPPDPAHLPPGCPFVPRCAFAQKACSLCENKLVEVGPNHFTACCRRIRGEITL